MDGNGFSNKSQDSLQINRKERIEKRGVDTPQNIGIERGQETDKAN